MPFLMFADLHPFAAIFLVAIVAATFITTVMCVCDAIVRMIGEG